MVERKKIYVFAYDIEDDRRRRAVSKMLEKSLVRVQYSVFEGQLNKLQSEKLYMSVLQVLVPGDNLRVYAISRKALAGCKNFSPIPFPEEQRFWLL